MAAHQNVYYWHPQPLLQPQLLLHPHPNPLKNPALPLPHPQHKQRRIIIQRELQPLSQPQPLLHPHPLFPSKRRRRIIIHTIELQLLHPLHPPQFVAAKSLI